MSALRRFAFVTLVLAALVATWAVRMFHVGTFRPPALPAMVTFDATTRRPVSGFRARKSGSTSSSSAVPPTRAGSNRVD